MKNQIIITLCVLFIFQMGISQKVDIDKHRFYVEYAKFPKHFVNFEDRSFIVEINDNSNFNMKNFSEDVAIRGWEQNQEEGKAKVVVTLTGFSQGKAIPKTRKEETKNKEGKVIKTTRHYSVSSSNVGKAYMKIYGPKNPYIAPEKTSKKKKKKKKKKEKKKKEKKKEVNPFLQDVNIDVADEGEEENPEELAGTMDLSISYDHNTGETSSSRKASENFQSNESTNYNNDFAKFQNDLVPNINRQLNAFYGFSRKRDWAKFKKLDSKKHPEYETYKNATDALRTILEKKRFNQNNDQINEAIAPLIAYFRSVAEKYNEDNKHQKRLKSASLWNIAQIHYYLDNPDGVIAIGNELIRWGHDEDHGEDFVEKGKLLKHELAFYQQDGRYVVTSENADDIESEDDSESDND